MIFVSSSCVKNKYIKDSVIELVNNGFRNIELSGGTEYYEGLIDDLLDLREKYNVNFICHNYFPPPQKHFVLNLASLNDEIFSNTLHHLKNGIKLSTTLGSERYGFHAGYFIDMHVSEIGLNISKHNRYNKNKSMQRFTDAFKEIRNYAGDVKLYIENNVISITNYRSYDEKNIFMLCSYDDFVELKNEIDFNLLLDVGHLKVSANTLRLDFKSELLNMIKYSDYIHISDNDGMYDLNYHLGRESELYDLLKHLHLKNKIFTLEIYQDIPKIIESYELLYELIQ